MLNSLGHLGWAARRIRDLDGVQQPAQRRAVLSAQAAHRGVVDDRQKNVLRQDLGNHPKIGREVGHTNASDSLGAADSPIFRNVLEDGLRELRASTSC